MTSFQLQRNVLIAMAKRNMWAVIYCVVMEFSMMQFHVMLNYIKLINGEDIFKIDK